MLKLRKLAKRETGQATVTIMVVIGAVLIISVLLLLTMNAAVSINKKAQSIDENAVVINSSGDSIPLLKDTNAIADSILETAAPLEGQVSTIRDLATNIDANATGIDNTAATIVTTALGINAEAVDILDTAREIDENAKTITGLLDFTVSTAGGILTDADEILREATMIHRDACGLVLGGNLGNNLGENCSAINISGDGHG